MDQRSFPGNAQASILVKRIKYELEPGMPFKSDRLSQNEISRIADWINAGASYNEGPLRLSGLGDPAVAQSRNDHWAFKPPTRPSIPTVRNASSIQNPIDAFVAAENKKRGLKPLPQADKRVSLRRLYLDLIGLPPTPAEAEAFLADRSKDAYEKVVERLLASPRYGERWGRHWMDIWRYSDTDGFMNGWITVKSTCGIGATGSSNRSTKTKATTE